MEILLICIALIAYSIAFVQQCLHLTGYLRGFKKSWFIFSWIAILSQAWLLHLWIDLSQGQDLAISNVFSLTMWIMVLFIVVTAVRKPVESLSLFIFPVSMVSILVAGIHDVANTDIAVHTDTFIHVWLALFAFSVLCVATIQAIVLAIQDFLVRRHIFLVITQLLPPIQTMEALLFQMIWFGFALLTLVLISAIYFFGNIFASALLAKTLFSILAWIVFGVILLGRFIAGWRGRKAIFGALIGLILLFFAYFGVNAAL